MALPALLEVVDNRIVQIAVERHQVGIQWLVVKLEVGHAPREVVVGVPWLRHIQPVLHALGLDIAESAVYTTVGPWSQISLKLGVVRAFSELRIAQGRLEGVLLWLGLQRLHPVQILEAQWSHALKRISAPKDMALDHLELLVARVVILLLILLGPQLRLALGEIQLVRSWLLIRLLLLLDYKPILLLLVQQAFLVGDTQVPLQLL